MGRCARNSKPKAFRSSSIRSSKPEHESFASVCARFRLRHREHDPERGGGARPEERRRADCLVAARAGLGGRTLSPGRRRNCARPCRSPTCSSRRRSARRRFIGRYTDQPGEMFAQRHSGSWPEGGREMTPPSRPLRFLLLAQRRAAKRPGCFREGAGAAAGGIAAGRPVSNRRARSSIRIFGRRWKPWRRRSQNFSVTGRPEPRGSDRS